MSKRKPLLSTQEFIYRVATEPKFRDKYLAKPELLEEEYAVDHLDLDSIRRIDAKALIKELGEIRNPEIAKIGASFASKHTNDSHSNHCKGGDPHCKNSHEKGTSDIMQGRIDQIILPESLAGMRGRIG